MSEGTMAEVLAGEATWCVVEGDCLDVMTTLPDASVDHVITDPPYEAEAHKGARRRTLGGGTGCEEYQIPFPPIGAEERVVVGRAVNRLAQRWVLAFCQVEAVQVWREAIGGKWRRAGVWVKPDASPQFNGNGWAQGYECIASAWVGPGHSCWNGGGRRGVLTHCINAESRSARLHPTTKPVPLMLELVSLFTDPGDLILDPFAGSGTTGVAALRLGRRVILVEREPKWAELCRERLRAEESQSTLQAQRSGQVAMFGKETA